MISNNPNAAVSLVTGGGLGSLIAWGAGKLGAPLTPTDGAAIAGAVSAAALYVGRDGIRGLLRVLMNGADPPGAAPATPAAPSSTTPS